MASVYTRNQAIWGAWLRRLALAACLLTALVIGGAAPAQAHTVGPQLITQFDQISPADPWVSYQILSTGGAPYVTVSVAGNHTFEIFGWLGEPFIRISSAGVQVNENSPSVEFMIDDPTRAVALPPVDTAPTRWQTVSSGSVFHYYERRAEWPHLGQPREAQALGHKTVVYRFSLPASCDATPCAIVGHVTWVPAPINLEIPLLFVPIAVVLLLWLEPKAKPYIRQIAPLTAGLVGIGALIAGARTVLALHSAGSGLAGLAPLSVLPGLAVVPLLVWPSLLGGDRRAYAWTLLAGVYLIVFGIIRVDLASTSQPTLVTWLRRGEILDGILTACSAGLLLFLTSPVRLAPSRGRPAATPRGGVANGRRNQ